MDYMTLSAVISCASGGAIGATVAWLLRNTDIESAHGLEGVVEKTIRMINQTEVELFIVRAPSYGAFSPFDNPDVRAAIYNARGRGVKVTEVRGHTTQMAMGSDVVCYSQDYRTLVWFKGFPQLADVTYKTAAKLV